MMWVTSDDGARLAAYDFGGTGHPLLLAHATGLHAHAWMPVVELLSDRFHCYAFDQRGHGATPTPVTGDFAWRRGAEDVRAVLAAFGLDRPGGVGHSGGAALLALAEEAPGGAFDRLWLYEPVITPPPPPDRPSPAARLSDGARRRRARFDSRAAARDNFASKPPFDRFTPAALDAYLDHGLVDDPAGGMLLACRPQDEAATYDEAIPVTVWDGLGEVAVPVHVVAGAETTHLPARLMAQVVARLPDASLEVVDRLGHFGPLEDPARVAASIARTFGTAGR